MVTTVTLSTQFPLHSGGTQALKAPYVINARGTFTTRVLSTFIFICRKNIEKSPMECLKPSFVMVVTAVFVFPPIP